MMKQMRPRRVRKPPRRTMPVEEAKNWKAGPEVVDIEGLAAELFEGGDVHAGDEGACDEEAADAGERGDEGDGGVDEAEDDQFCQRAT